jgi:ketosteroid isomerase-like protein
MAPLSEKEFHDLEEAERRAVLASDAAAIERFWSPELLVNGPHNRLLIGIDSTLDMVRSGTIDFERFDRVVERVEIDGDIAVSMGSEAIVQRRGPQAGQLINRRYTNVWRRTDGGWQLRFRHANVIPPQGQILDQVR